MVAFAAVLAVAGISACGSDDHDKEPRPPVTAQVSVEFGDDTLSVSPREFGAGITRFTIINLGGAASTVEIDGPTVGESAVIAPGDTAGLSMQMETGDYTATAPETNVEPFRFRVGPERASGSDQLLLP